MITLLIQIRRKFCFVLIQTRGGGGVLKKNFDGGVRLRFSIGYPWLRKFWSKTYPWLKRISWSWAHFYMILRNFSPNIPFLREIFRKQTPFMGFHEKIYLWLRTSEENIPLAKESGLKKWPLGAARPSYDPHNKCPPGDTDYDQIVTGTFSQDVSA